MGIWGFYVEAKGLICCSSPLAAAGVGQGRSHGESGLLTPHHCLPMCPSLDVVQVCASVSPLTKRTLVNFASEVMEKHL